MKSDEFEIGIASVPHREELVAEIFYRNEQWVEISSENGIPMIVFCKKKNGGNWEFELDKALEALEYARKCFLDMGGKRN
jgi:hypothetical protein